MQMPRQHIHTATYCTSLTPLLLCCVASHTYLLIPPTLLPQDYTNNAKPGSHKILGAVATEHGPKKLEAILELANRPSSKAGAPVVDIFTRSLTDPSPLLIFGAKISKTAGYNAAFFVRNANIMRMDPAWPHYAYIKAGLSHLTDELRKPNPATPTASSAAATSTSTAATATTNLSPAADYNNATIRTYSSPNPTITINGVKTPCCTMEITTADGSTHTAAIVDDSVLSQLPYSNRLSTPLASTPLRNLATFLGSDHPAVLANLTVASEHDASIIKTLTFIKEKDADEDSKEDDNN